MQFIKPDDRPASAQQHTYSLWVRLIAYWTVTLLFFPLGAYLFYKDLEARDRPLLTIVVGMAFMAGGTLALGLMVALVKAVVH